MKIKCALYSIILFNLFFLKTITLSSTTVWTPSAPKTLSKVTKKTIFLDKFEDNRNKWQINKKRKGLIKKITNGHLHLEATSNDSRLLTNSIPFNTKKDFEIEATIKFVSGRKTLSNDLCWGSSNYTGHRFHFGFSANGHYSASVKKKRYHDFIPWTPTSVHQNGYNKVTIRKIKNTYQFYFNNKLVHEMPFKAFFGSEIGFMVAGKSTIYIDYLKISEINQQFGLVKNKKGKVSGKLAQNTNKQKSQKTTQKPYKKKIPKPSPPKHNEAKQKTVDIQKPKQTTKPKPSEKVVVIPPVAPPTSDSNTAPTIEVNRRVALIIGNEAYQNGKALRNPLNDAKAMQNSLQNLDFQVTTHSNTKLKEMRDAVREFGETLQEGDLALFYYSGHGIQVKGQNYLIPIDANLADRNDAKWETLGIHDVLAAMETSKNSLNILILDACRDNPFKSWSSTSDLGDDRGFAIVPVSSGTFVAFATSAGAVAADGYGENGVYTHELIKHLKSGQRIEDVFMKTRNSVEEATQGRQSPQEWSKLRGIFRF